MSSHSVRRWPVFVALALLCALAAAPARAVTPTPVWSVESLPLPTNFVPGDEAHNYRYEVRVVDITGAPLSNGTMLITDTLPAGLGVKKVALNVPITASGTMIDGSSLCQVLTAGEVKTVRCEVPAKVAGQSTVREALTLQIFVSTPPVASGTLTNLASVQGAGAGAVSATSENRASATPAPSGISQFHSILAGPEGLPAARAGTHPYEYTTGFLLNTELPAAGGNPIPANGDIKDIKVTLPPGLIGNPTATARCTAQQFNTLVLSEGQLAINACPPGSAIGQIDALVEGSRLVSPIYNLVPPLGMPAQLGFLSAGFPFYIDTSVKTGAKYEIVASLRNVSEIKRPLGGRVTIWGVPGDPSHDRQRSGACLNALGLSVGSCPSGLAPRPFLRLPTSCSAPLVSAMLIDTWIAPGISIGAESTSPTLEDCASLDFSPAIVVQPQTKVADTPSGLAVNLHIPQNDDPELLAEADLRNAVVTLPKGVSVNPASAGGLAGCSSAQIELNGPEPARCPDASKVGSVEVQTPLLDHPIKGAVYVASQSDNPFHSLIAIYITAYDQQSGVVLKLAGQVSPDPATGQLTTTFTDNPQIPFDDLTVTFFEGPRAPLRMPPTCGTYTTTTAMRPWSAPESGADATPSDSFSVGRGPTGPCPDGGLRPSLSAGVTTPIAGSSSPFVMRLTREDGSGEFSAITAVTPPGLTAKLKGIPYCPEAGIAAALGRGAPGDGAAELASPSCPVASKVGTSTAGAGAGSSPFYTSGNLYLAGPYKGAPLSMVAVIPAIAGPFDLGVVVNRIALQVNSETAQVTAVSDSFPTILSGIPLDVRDIRINLDRSDFTLAPTSCEPKTVAVTVFGINGASAKVSDRFQVGACKGLDFAPKLALHLKGGTKRSDYPALRAVLEAKSGEANIGRVSVALPHSEFLAQEHIRTICTRVQFAAKACPKGSIYGHARAFTPLLGEPLEGPVYLRSSSHPLPDLVVALHGQIDVDLIGRIDSVNGGIRSTFGVVPDAPVTKFVLNMEGGKKGLLVNSRNLCASTNRATVKMKGQNGKLHNFNPTVSDSCRKQKSKRHVHHKQRH